MPRTNNAGVALIQGFEDCVLYTYDDAIYPPQRLQHGTKAQGTPTIGWGHTGPEVVAGLTWTQAQANAAFYADLAHFEKCVNDMVSHNLTPNQFAALVSFAYNTGCEALRGSTLMRLLNEGDVQGAADQFGEWVKSDGKTLEGLVHRRAAERALFLT